MDISDRFDLARFRTAHQGVLETALAELRAGRKCSHWMWFIFPQLRGLGHSTTAQFYGICSIEEARAYIDDPVLGDRLKLATEATLALDCLSANVLFGSPDDMKFHSSMTLFSVASGVAGSPFQLALDRYFAGTSDARTLALLGCR